MSNNHEQNHDAAVEACSICQRNLTNDYGVGFSRGYPNMICRLCSRKAVNSTGDEPTHNSIEDDGRLVLTFTTRNDDENNKEERQLATAM